MFKSQLSKPPQPPDPSPCWRRGGGAWQRFLVRYAGAKLAGESIVSPSFLGMEMKQSEKTVYLKKKHIMILERTKDEIFVRLPAYVDLTELQNMLDYLQYKELTAKSKAKQTDVDELSQAVNRSIMNKVNIQRGQK
ncbi:MAG: hypothetical protein NT004_14980 [Bacteroidetes bacterium]|nr:hypothetical protein [Bacteroidota bacterium]